MTKFIKKSALMLVCAIFLLLVIGSVQAGDSNDTSVLADVDIETDAVDVDLVSEENSVGESNVKTFTDLEDRIHGFSTSVVTLNESYKFNPDVDVWNTYGTYIYSDMTLIGENNCYIDGSNSIGLLCIDSNCNVVLENITFKNGKTTNVYSGSAIRLGEGSNLTIINCVFESNIVENLNGGALFTQENTNITIRNSTFKGNIARDNSGSAKLGMGSAIYADRGSSLNMYDSKFIGNNAKLATVLLISSLDGIETIESHAYVENCLFENNKADKYSGFYLDEYGTAEFINSTFKNNNAQVGGALILDSTPYALIKNCVFEKNSGTSGAAVRLAHDHDSSNVEVIGSKFSQNTAEYGGAIYSDNAKLKVLNCTFNANKASETGGAIREINNGKIEVYNSSFTGNSAKKGGAIFSSTRDAASYNCTYIKNSASESYPDVYGAVDINIQTVSSYFGDVKFKVKVTTPWETLVSQEVRIKLISGKTVFYSPADETNEEGIAYLKVADKTAVGKYSVELSRHEGECTINKLSVNVITAPCTVSFNKVTMTYSCINSVKGYITNSKTKNPVSGTRIKIKVYTGKSYRTYTPKLGDDGSFTINTAKLAAGKHTVEITSYDKNIKMSKFTSSINVNKATAKIVVPKTAKKNSKVKVKVKNSVSGKPIKKITFKIVMKVGSKKKTVVVKSSSKGVLKFDLKKLSKGKCKMNILTKNKNYNINQKFKLKIN